MTPLERALALARGGQGALQVHRQRINDLNVYPVPDGDTGSNLADTVTRLTQGLEQLPPDADRPTIAHAATRTVLMGARGNSGVILSQIVRGFAEALGAGEGPVDAGTVARALRAASDAAYGAVRQPVEGTMLTAIRAMAERAEAEPADASIDDLLAAVLEAGDDTVVRTQEMLPVLRQARVVDAGAAGLVEYVRGAVAGMQHRRPAAVGALAAAPPPSLDSIHLQPSRYRYCTSFLVEDEGVDRELLESLLEPLGDSLLVVGEPPILKVHLHTDDPGAAISLGVGAGTVADVEVADMRVQVRDRTLRLLEGAAAAPAACGLVAVADGDGVVAAYRAAASAVELVAGGQSANPSAGEIADAIAASAAEGVLVLPNNRNVVLAAENAAALAGRPAAVVPTLSPAAGLVLAERFDPGRALAENAGVLAQLNGTLRCGEVAAAVRDAQMDGVAVTAGQYLALVEGRLQSSHDEVASAAAAVLRDLAQGAAELTVLTAAEAGLSDAIDALAADGAGPAVRTVEGGAAAYPLFACATPGAGLLTAETTAIVLDSTADLADPGSRHGNWSMVPLTVSFGDQTFHDYVDIDAAEFYRRLRGARQPPRTAAPSPGAWQEAFEALASYRRVLVLPVSSRLSASSQTAELAARAVDPGGLRITVLETGSASLGTLVLAEALQRRLVRGLPENELVTWFQAARERLHVVFSVDTLEYLQRGGRIGRAQAMVGGMLGLRPILTLRDGEVEPLRRVRGARRARAEFERFLIEHAGPGSVHVAVVHAEAPEAAEQLVEMARRAVPHAVIDHVGELGAVVGTHGGPGTLGLAVLSEP
jgi:DAK2 domain fusion protein YloV